MHRRSLLTAAGAAALLGCAPRADAASEADAAARFHRQRRYVQVRAGNIAVTDEGRGPAALFLHGFPLNGFQWRGVIERVRTVRRCIAPDFLGLGYTKVAPGQSLAPEAQVEMLEELLDRLGVASVDVVANDSGLAVAQLLLAKRPERVRTLLATNGDVEIDSPPAALLPVIELAKAGGYADAWLRPWVADPDLARSAEGLGGMCYSRPDELSNAAIATYLAPLVDGRDRTALTDAYAVALERNALAGVGERLRTLRTPIRIVWGDQDTIFSRKSPDYLAELMPGFRGMHRIPTGKLFFPEEHPDVVADEARRLWA